MKFQNFYMLAAVITRDLQEFGIWYNVVACFGRLLYVKLSKNTNGKYF